MSTTTINGRVESLPDDQEALLVDVIRDRLNLTGTKLVCGSGVCGACTVLLDGEPVVSCLLPASATAGKKLTTIEGIGDSELHPIQKAFMAHDALQCGFCTRDLWWGQLPSIIVGVRRKARQSRRAKRSPPRCRAIFAAAAPMKESIALSLRLVPDGSTATIRTRRAWKRATR